MKLIDLIVKHVPRDEIHPDAKFFAQDTDGNHETWGFSKKPRKDVEGVWLSGHGPDNCLVDIPVAEDASTTVITRDELMQAYVGSEKAHVDTVDTAPEYSLCIFPLDNSEHTEIGLLPGSQITVENEWLTVRHNRQLVGMFRMENIAAWLINKVTK